MSEGEFPKPPTASSSLGLWLIAGFLFCSLLGLATWAFITTSGKKGKYTLPEKKPAQQEFDWEDEARKTLSSILEAKTPEDILKHVLASEEVKELVLSDSGTLEPLSAELFSSIYLQEGMQADGFYGMIYQRPAYTNQNNFLVFRVEIRRLLDPASIPYQLTTSLVVGSPKILLAIL